MSSEKCIKIISELHDSLFQDKLESYFPRKIRFQFYPKNKKWEWYEFGHPWYVYTARIPTIKISWFCRYALNTCLHWLTSIGPSYVTGLLLQLQIKSLVNGSLHQHIHRNLIFITSKSSLCLPKLLNFHIASRHSVRRACDKGTANFPHAVQYHDMWLGSVLCQAISRSALVWGTPVPRFPVSDDVAIADTPYKSQLYLQPVQLLLFNIDDCIH